MSRYLINRTFPCGSLYTVWHFLSQGNVIQQHMRSIYRLMTIYICVSPHSDFPWRPNIEEITQFIWFRDQPTTLLCKISSFFPDALTVSWIEKKKGAEWLIPGSTRGKYQIPDMRSERRKNNTYTCTAQLSLSPSSCAEKDVEFICRVAHPSLEQPIEESTGIVQFKGETFEIKGLCISY